MNINFTDESWEDYLYWQKTDKKMVKKINELIKYIKRNPYTDIGKPGSRRINQEHRLVQDKPTE